MRRVGPIVAKSTAEVRRRRRADDDDRLGGGGGEVRPHRYLKDMCHEPVIPSPRCVKPHFHVKGDYCDRYGVDLIGEVEPRRRCLADHFHTWLSENMMKRVIKEEAEEEEERADEGENGEGERATVGTVRTSVLDEVASFWIH